jgi:hypothetical protein
MMRLIIHTYIFHIVGKEFTGILGGSESFPSDIPVPTQCDGSGLCWKFGTLFASLTLTRRTMLFHRVENSIRPY